MNSILTTPLNTSLEQAARLQALQLAFAEVCNALAPVAQERRCWNRVALHHLTYRVLREKFPQMGSQMICNAIYSVSRTCRLVYQHPGSPFNVAKHPEAPLPAIRFAPSAPVYFDRHTLSIKDDKLSMYTLDGRMKFQLQLGLADLERFQSSKLREIVLSRSGEQYQLTFIFNPGDSLDDDVAETSAANTEFPEYLLIFPREESMPPGMLMNTIPPPLLSARP
jgi:hypothetical protein